MGDYTGAGFVLWHASPKKKLKIEELLVDVLGSGGFDRGGDGSLLLKLGEWGEYSDVRCGSVSEYSDQLVKLAPKAIWQFYEDPKYEWMGTCAWYHPDAGLFEGTCDTNCNPVLGYDELVETGILISPESDEYDVGHHLAAYDKIAARLGIYQRDAIELFKQSKALTVS